MINFYCVHCGLHMSADPSYSGADSQCPSCKGIVKIPSVEGEPTIVEAIPTSTNNKKSFWKVDRKGIFTIVAISLVSLLIYGNSVSNDLAEERDKISRENLRQALRKAQERSLDAEMKELDAIIEKIKPPKIYETIDLNLPTFYEVSGMELMLYGEPKREYPNIPKKLKEVTVGHEYHVVNEGGIEVLINHSRDKYYKVSLEGAVNGHLSSVRNSKGVTNFKYVKMEKFVSSQVGYTEAMWVSLHYDLHGRTYRYDSLIITKGDALWSINVRGESSNPKLVGKINKMFGHVMILK